uniref:Uncharacterized protein n=1 Tax=Anopheles melas TaxID=34690 RepID=A0A182UG93_9DIPT
MGLREIPSLLDCCSQKSLGSRVDPVLQDSFRWSLRSDAATCARCVSIFFVQLFLLLQLAFLLTLLTALDYFQLIFIFRILQQFILVQLFCLIARRNDPRGSQQFYEDWVKLISSLLSTDVG